MFYSQFILAKKGPLGTIWIAAHLERKLRKNQVADTDIGVSVDSILFPDVPIALRLSSHLLLGVVRIYSRKVNYLFDDCSEALLKIKQAFRSTAVDLPPEESTAPYHSITLPETFDLDDFELPENEIFQGNYVDHHISTREQITLQDTMESVVYPASQFGLDERFGDGDTSQIALDLDEDMFLDKVAASGSDGVAMGLDTDVQASVRPTTPLKIDEINKGTAETSDTMFDDGNSNQMHGVAASIDLIECADAPATPGLTGEPSLATTQEPIGFDDNLVSVYHNSAVLEVEESMANCSSNSNHHLENKSAVDCFTCDDVNLGDDMNQDDVPSISADKKSSLLSHLEIKPGELEGDYLASDYPNDASILCSDISKQANSTPRGSIYLDRLGKLEDGIQNNGDTDVPVAAQSHMEGAEAQRANFSETASYLIPSAVSIEPSSDIEIISGKSVPSGTIQPVSEGIEFVNTSSTGFCAVEHETPSPHNSENKKDSKTVSCVVPEEMSFACMHILQPCVSHGKEHYTLSQEGKIGEVPASSSEVNIDGQCTLEAAGMELVSASGSIPELQGKECDAVDARIQVSDVTSILESTTFEDNQAYCRKLDEQLSNVISRDAATENLERTPNSEFPAPEKLLSVPEVPSDLPSNCFVDSTQEKEVQVEAESNGAGLKFIAGEHQSLEESVMSLQSLNSDESFELRGIKRTASSSVPNDDDLLSSILVGRKSSVFKMRPTPPPEVAPMKRIRTGPRSSTSKRKVLMDDSMILHGDTIRQQLLSTEDIRRMRKKAPCTRSEIWLIQKKFLDDEIFSEPITTGMSKELFFLHGRTYDLTGIKVFPHDENGVSHELPMPIDVPVGPSVSEPGKGEEMLFSSVARNDKEAMSAETAPWDKNHKHEEPFDNVQVHTKDSMDPSELSNSQTKVLHDRSEIEIVRASSAPSNAADHVTVLGVDLFPVTPSEKEACHMAVESGVQSAAVDKVSEAGGSVLLDASRPSPDRMFNEHVFHNNASDPNGDYVFSVGNGFASRPNLLVEGAEAGQSVEDISFVRDDCSVSVGYVNPPLINLSGETTELNSKDAVTDDLTREENGKNELRFVNEDVVEGPELDDYKNPPFSHIHDEDPSIYASCSIEPNADMKNVSSNDAESLGCKETEAQIIMDMENMEFDERTVEATDDFKDSMIGHDTEFLNVDDEDFDDENDSCMPASEQRFLENSGWSSRTRAVAKYLQTLFDREAEKGETVLPMDNLLIGKTRKEASRMFFETLVLKTRDYVHVEQNRPFDNIGIRPRMKLMKSDF